MTEKRSFNLWHALSLVMAFVAGAAIVSDSPFKRQASGEFSAESDGPGLIADAADSDTRLGGDLGSEETDVFDVAVGESNQRSVGGKTPEALQTELNELWERSKRADAEIADLNFDLIDLTNRFEESGIVLQNDADINENIEAALEVAELVETQVPSAESRRTALIDSGVDPSVIDDIEYRQDQVALARLELLDRAAREGWSETDRLNDELEELSNDNVDLRDELGDNAYDLFLFNSGRPNRVVVASVIAGSVADVSGLKVGDIILAYANFRIFSMQELRDATREGVRDEPIVIEVLRSQSPLTLDIVRGPLGITMSATNVDPNA